MTAGRAAAPAALVAALALAALAAGNAPVLGEASRQVGQATRAGAVALVLAVWLGVLAAAIAAGVQQRIQRAGDAKARAPWYKQLALVAATTALVCFAMAGGVTVTGLLAPDDQTRARGDPEGTATERPGPTATPDPNQRPDEPPPAWLVALLLAAGATAVALTYRRLTATPAGTDDEPDELDAALQAALDALRPPADDRDAVLAAYAAMERELAEAGLRRSPWEAPREYLRRVLAEGRPDSGSPAGRLTALFEHARFSPDPVTAADRAGAEAALAALRRPVAGGPLPPGDPRRGRDAPEGPP